MSAHPQHRPNYFRVMLTFLQNSLIREMTFRGNFIITVITRAFWFAAQLVLFEVIFSNVNDISGWSREEYFVFMATGMLINSLIETFFMPNCANFSELIRTGNLDFALLKPIDTQFLISFERVNIAMLTQSMLAVALLIYSLAKLHLLAMIGWEQIVVYLVLIGVGVTFFYSMMITLASSSIWFGRNQGLYDFWFYITVFARYPMSIYSGTPVGEIIRFAFAYIIPILLVVTLPAQVLVDKMHDVKLIGIAVVAAILGLLISRAIFQFALRSYRSASS